MSYIGQHLPPDVFGAYTADTFTGDGSATTFTLSKEPASDSALLVVVDNVIQQPTTNFTVSGTTLTIVGTAILSGITGYAIHTGGVLPIGAASSLENSTNAFTIGAAGTASSLAGIPFYNGDTTSIYTHDVSGTDSTATHNTAYGITAMDAITTGDANTAIGWSAGSALNTGTQNTIVGKGALASASSAGSNTAIGWNAAYAVTTGTTAITAIGDGAYNSAGDTETHNMAIGVNAMAAGSLAGAEYNTAIGNYALDAVTSGDSNTTVGYNCATRLTTGNFNQFYGEQAGQHVTTGNHNTGIGYSAGGTEATSTGSENTCLGNYAGFGITSGSSNVILGYDCAHNVSSGSNNIMIGNDAGTTGSPGGNITTASNTISLGDENIGTCNIQTDWTVASDQRDKTDFTALDIGLDFVNDLKPYTYKWDKRIKYVSEADRNTVDLDTITHDGTYKEDWLDIGFKAQEVETLEKAAGYKIADKTNLTTSLTENGKQYGIKYSKFIPILVKAVQELSAKVKALEDA
jgi:hypothetical protein